MATGIPQTKRKQDFSAGALEWSQARHGELLLTYPGKKEELEILAMPPTSLRLVWDGHSSARNPQYSNRLYFGDNLPILLRLLTDTAIRGRVKLVYIDPPYSTNSIFQSRAQQDAYADMLSGYRYIEFLRERLIVLRELLADDGSIYVHLDENMAFHVKVIMDEVFGRENFRNWITRKKCNPKNYTRKTFGNISDFILFYTKGSNYVWNRPLETWTTERAHKEYPYVEPATGRRYKKVPIHAPGVRNGETGKAWRGMFPPPGKHWQYQPATLDEMDARGEIYWSPTGNPRRKVYLDASEGVPVQDIWLGFRDAHNQNIHITGYPTEKNPDLIRLIVEASSNPGDLVLDCFVGSGTTLEIAARHERQWIGIDNSLEAIKTTLTRLSHGTKPMGDFVDARKDKRLAQSRNPMLFDFEQDATVLELEDENKPILDFALECDTSRYSELESVVAEWTNGFSRQLDKLKEHRPNYQARMVKASSARTSQKQIKTKKAK